MKRFHSPLANCLLAGCLLLAGASVATADVRVGVHLSVFPNLVPVPGYPVYYAPDVSANFFFYDGDYWLYDDDGWYTSPWYDGPWEYVHPDFVPLFVLRVPVRYYRAPPPYFWGWHHDAPPRWGHYWGPQWEHRHGGWDHWDRYRVPRPAPLPSYQRGYDRDRYPDRDRQRELRDEHYRYRPQDGRSQHYREPARQPDRQQFEPRHSELSPRGWQRADDRGPSRSESIRDEGQRNDGRGSDFQEGRRPMQEGREPAQERREPSRDSSNWHRESSVDQPQRMTPRSSEREVRQDQPRAEMRGNGRQMEDRGDRGRGGDRDNSGRNNDGGAWHGRDH